MRNLTSIVIAHRLATIIDADRIAVLDQGLLLALGSHNELLKTCELFSQMACLHFRESEEFHKHHSSLKTG